MASATPTDWTTIPFKLALDGEIRAAIIAQLVQYLLFMRGQIPWYG